MLHSYTCRVDADALAAFCALEAGFTDQFVYYRKDRPFRYLGLGRCIALRSLDEEDARLEGPDTGHEPVLFSFRPFDAGRRGDAGADAGAGAGGADAGDLADDLMDAFPNLSWMLPEIVVIEDETGTFLQVNSLSPVRAARVERFLRRVEGAGAPARADVPVAVEADDPAVWEGEVARAQAAIADGAVEKVVLARRLRVSAARPFSARDLVVNLALGGAVGTVVAYRYADVFFCGCTPELLVRKRAGAVESMCLAGTCPRGTDAASDERLAAALLADHKNRAEHEYVVGFMRAAFGRLCHGVEIPAAPGILKLAHVQHLHTPVRARVLDGVTLEGLVEGLQPTPAVSGAPVGEAKMLIRSIEPAPRGLYAGACGVATTAGDGEFSVALRTGVFDGEGGWAYAGCGIVAESDAAVEYDETDAKLKTILSAFDGVTR